MRSQITLLHKQLQTTFVYVTHDQTEAMTMADRIVVMDKGIIRQYDTPKKLYDEPADTFVAGFIGKIRRGQPHSAGGEAFGARLLHR